MTTHSDPMERMVAAALTKAGLPYADETHPDAHNLDFFVPERLVHIEVKQFYSERSVRQMERAPFVILAQGRYAVAWLAEMITKSAAYDRLMAKKSDAA
jgi:hypothetical protein